MDPLPLSPADGETEPHGASGPLLFARYAFPPNELGYCGPDGASVLLDHATSGGVEPEVLRRAREFDGAWPYLELIAAAAGIEDPLDPRVVEAYWVGNDLLNQVEPDVLLSTLGAKFSGQVGGLWPQMQAASNPQAHHSFHVYAVYPWFGLLGRGGDVPLSVLDQCRIRWGTVVEVQGEHATVRSQPLVWDGETVGLGAERDEPVRWSTEGRSLRSGLTTGDQVSLHWDWVCDVLSDLQVEALARYSSHQLELVNQQSRLPLSG